MEFFKNNPQLLLLGGLMLIMMFFMSRVAKRRKRGPVSILSPHEQIERLKQARGMRGDLEHLMVEIEQMAKRMGAHLDAKAVHIEHLLQEVDERIAKLEALKNQSPSRPHNQMAGEAPAESSGESSDAANMQGASDAETDNQPDAAADALPDDPLARNVYELADQGHDSQQIAKQLDEHVGKIELILALRSA